jgi:hypothetical protein
MCNSHCPCWNKNINHPRKCPICGQIFNGKGWEGIDEHYKKKHKEVNAQEPYEMWWSRMCEEHRAMR